jgi:hypothetical protein
LPGPFSFGPDDTKNHPQSQGQAWSSGYTPLRPQFFLGFFPEKKAGLWHY